MKTTRFLLVLTAFLIMISSVLTLRDGGDTGGYLPVYINIAAMITIAIAVTIKKKK
jgi:hypothetical protein